MNRVKTALLYGGGGFVVAFPVLIIGSYITCLTNGLDYNWPIALIRGVKGSVFMGVVWAVLKYMAGGIPSDHEKQ